MTQDNIVISKKIKWFIYKDYLYKELLDYQVKKLMKMEQQLYAVENLELASLEKQMHWRHILLREQHLLFKNKK